MRNASQQSCVPCALCRSMYRTNRHAGDASTFKLGFRGKNICYNGNQTCPTREHFIKKVAAKYPVRVAAAGRLS